MAHPTAPTTTPFFVMGAPRSGTTLVAQMLDAHSRLAVYLEMHYFGTFEPIVDLYGDLGVARNRRRFLRDVARHIRMQHTEPPTIEEIERAMPAPSLEGVLEAILALFARAQGKARGGEKTPLHFRHLPRILDRFPDSPVIYLMRDPRDVVFSMRRLWGTPLVEAAGTWNDAALAVGPEGSDRVLVVRYETLVSDPVGQARSMCRVLAEEFEAGMVAPRAAASPQLSAVRHLDLTRLGSAIDASTIGTHHQMSPAEIATIEAVCREGMLRHGYHPSQVPVAVPLAPPTSLLREGFGRLRYYGVNRERWRRGAFRWRLVAGAHARHALAQARPRHDGREPG